MDPSAFFTLTFKSKNVNPECAAARHPINFLEKTEFLTKTQKKFGGRGEQLEERFDYLVEAGLDYNALVSMVKLQPNVLNQSKEILMKKIDFLNEYLGYPVDSIVRFPAYLCYDMEKSEKVRNSLVSTLNLA